MPSKKTYLIQLVGLVLVVIGLVLTFKHPAITAHLLSGSLAWTVGRYLRKNNLP